MLDSGKINNIFSVVIGAFLLLAGIWGIYSDVIFNVLTTSFTFAIIQIMFGVMGIVLGLKKHAKGYCILLGLLLIGVGILRFVPAVHYVIDAFNINEPAAYLNMALGIMALIVAYTGKERVHAS
ncbi:hypothetical protein [Flavobacterium sp. GT3R68]|uniref:hypothetical protein n=1 Tax=Flavobacterium sp. GT3R68 TaxID=2594437 RepID=UPI000F898035|nr:hypothetical protein [Flavobacterium sp. GT3R68]RTY89124.1 hypothetical protein EKL32_24180 [Flavobacterium sp. GSN2]TRW90078.1 hypothetical protein FNW07_11510 [Flavobacterium sp. GT3R68]